MNSLALAKSRYFICAGCFHTHTYIPIRLFVCRCLYLHSLNTLSFVLQVNSKRITQFVTSPFRMIIFVWSLEFHLDWDSVVRLNPGARTHTQKIPLKPSNGKFTYVIFTQNVMPGKLFKHNFTRLQKNLISFRMKIVSFFMLFFSFKINWFHKNCEFKCSVCVCMFSQEGSAKKALAFSPWVYSWIWLSFKMWFRADIKKEAMKFKRQKRKKAVFKRRNNKVAM